MFARLGMFPTLAGAIVVIAIGAWIIVTQTSILGNQDAPIPVVSAQDNVTAEAVEEAPAQEQPAEDAEIGASEEGTVEEISTNAEETPAVDEQPMEVAVPTFDIVRVDTDGTAVVAGSGPAGWDITVLVDDEVVATTTIDGSGKFVAFVDLGTSDLARIMTLRASQGDAIRVSDAQVIIAPVATQIASVEGQEDVAGSDDTTAAETETETPTATEHVASDVQQETPETPATPSVSTSDVVDDQVVDAGIAEASQDEAAESEASDGQETDNTTSESIETASSDDASSDTSEAGAVETTEQATSVDTAADTDEATSEVAVALETESADSDSSNERVSEDVTETDGTSDSMEANEATAESDATMENDAATAPAVLLVTDEGVNILQPASPSPEIIAELSIAAITYSEDGSVFLTGFSPAGFLRVYVNNLQVTVLEILEPGEWKAELVDVAPGIYTLRVDQVDENGDVIQRVETPFKREEPEKVVEVAQTRKPRVSLEVVQPGSNLWAISRQAYGSGVLYVRIFEANKDQIRDPHLIYPGQIFELPAPPGAQKQKRSSGQ